MASSVSESLTKPYLSPDKKTITYGIYPRSKAKKPFLPSRGYDDQIFEHGGERYVYRKDGWFKCEPLKWRVLRFEGDMALCIADEIIEGGTMHSIDYNNSDMRVWLLDHFESFAWPEGSEYVVERNVDNSPASTGNTTNKNATTDTTDYVFLPSRAELRDPRNGFIDGDGECEPRSAFSTDFAKARGCYACGSGGWGTDGYISAFWTRSPKPDRNGGYSNNLDLYYSVKSDGSIGVTNINCVDSGFRPCCWIRLNGSSDKPAAQSRPAAQPRPAGTKSASTTSSASSSAGNPGWETAEPGQYRVVGGRLVQCTIPRSGKLILPDGVRVIESKVFQDRQDLKGIAFPSSLVSIEPSAFNGCKNLTEVLGSSGAVTYGSHCFAHTGITDFFLGSGAVQIAEGMFRSCKYLRKVSLPAGLTHIGEYAFEGCEALQSLNIPSSVYMVGKNAFSWVRCNLHMPMKKPLIGYPKYVDPHAFEFYKGKVTWG